MKTLTKLALLATVAFGLTTAAQAQLAGWDTSGLLGGTNNYGPSPFAPTTFDSNISVVGLTRGPGVTQSGSAAARGWGGTDWQGANEAAAITGGDYFTFSLTSNAGFSFSLTSLDPFGYRRSASGPSSGELQFSLDATNFTDVASLSYSSTSSNGANLPAIDLSSISLLQNLTPGTTVTFRVVNWGGTGSTGNFYVYDVGNSTASDFSINGTLAVVPEPSVYMLLGVGLLFCGQRFVRRKSA